MNWDATFPWLYHGPWLPFENDRDYFPLGITTPSNTTTATTMTRKGEKETDVTMTDSFTWLNCDPAGHGGHAIRKLHPDWPKCMSQNDQLLKSWYDTLLLNLNVSFRQWPRQSESVDHGTFRYRTRAPVFRS